MEHDVSTEMERRHARPRLSARVRGIRDPPAVVQMSLLLSELLTARCSQGTDRPRVSWTCSDSQTGSPGRDFSSNSGGRVCQALRLPPAGPRTARYNGPRRPCPAIMPAAAGPARVTRGAGRVALEPDPPPPWGVKKERCLGETGRPAQGIRGLPEARECPDVEGTTARAAGD